MSYHKDKECNSAIIQLLDSLCQWERNTGRRSTLILIPHAVDESIVIAEDGKPLQIFSLSDEESARLTFKLALREREAKT